MKPRVLVLSGYGINCEAESANAFRVAGGRADVVHVNDLISGAVQLSGYQILMIPGGFSYGDDTGSGNAMACKIRTTLWSDLQRFLAADKLAIGICNGFQVFVALGLLPALTSYGKREVSLLANDSNRYECGWVWLKSPNNVCKFTKGISRIFVPVAHGEGKFYCTGEVYQKLVKNKQIVFTYCDLNGNDANGKYPISPNGALHDVAGICDPSGKVLGMMPHPERAMYWHSHPDYQKLRETARREGKSIPLLDENALGVFRGAVGYFSKK